MKYIYLLTFIILTSCGVVKKSSEESFVKDNSTTEIDLTKYSNSYTLEPVDLSKPILLGKDTIYNTRIIYNNTKEIVKEKKANNIEFKEEKKTKVSVALDRELLTYYRTLHINLSSLVNKLLNDYRKNGN
jgi:cell division protein FtsL